MFPKNQGTYLANDTLNITMLECEAGISIEQFK